MGCTLRYCWNYIGNAIGQLGHVAMGVGVALAAMAWSGCQPKAPIEAEKFEAIVQDILLTDGALLEVDTLRGAFHRGEMEPYTATLAAHGVTVADFDSALRYYLNRPRVLDEMFDRIIANLQMEATALQQPESLQMATDTVPMQE